MGNLWIYKTYLYQEIDHEVWNEDIEAYVIHLSGLGWVRMLDCERVTFHQVFKWFENDTFKLDVMA